MTEEEFRLTVGKGRLVDSWIVNVTSPQALYTDGSSRGAGKNARWHGKSTSDWGLGKEATEEGDPAKGPQRFEASKEDDKKDVVNEWNYDFNQI